MCVNRNAQKRLVVGIGELLWDLLPAGKQLGGAPTNFAYHAKAMGADAAVASCVGDDALGREILSRLDALGVDRRHVAVHPSAPTGTVEVRLDAKGVPDFIIHQNVAWDAISGTTELMELAGRADAVCFGSLAQRGQASRATIREFLRATRPQCVRVFDINLRQSYFSREIVDESLRASEVLKLNDQEMPVLTELLGGALAGAKGESEAVEQLMRDYSLRMVALTRGGAGSRLYVPGRMFEHPGYPAKVVDTVGAGDAFTAALTMGVLRGDEPARINETANRLASYVCTQAGATPPIPAGLIG
jgi:fructokinase